jgi:hypothetical protein
LTTTYHEVAITGTWDYGTVIGTVVKQRDDTALRVTFQTTMHVADANSACSVQLRVDGDNDLGSAGPAEFTGTEATTLSPTFVPATMVAVFTGLPAGSHQVAYKVIGSTCYVNRPSVLNAALVEETR